MVNVNQTVGTEYTLDIIWNILQISYDGIICISLATSQLLGAWFDPELNL